MWLRADETQKTAFRFVALTVGLCAAPALVVRAMSAAWTFATVGVSARRVFWFEVSQLGFSLTLCFSAAILLIRTEWFVWLSGASLQDTRIQAGDQRFWMCWVRAIGLSTVMFGAAWVVFSVFRFEAVIQSVPVELIEIRLKLIGGFAAVCVGLVCYFAANLTLGLFPYVLADEPSVRDFHDRSLLCASLWLAGVFTLTMRSVWLVHNAALLIAQPQWQFVVALVTEFVVFSLAVWLVTRCESIASRLQKEAFCVPCRLPGPKVQECLECGELMVANHIDTHGFSVRIGAWQSAWFRLVTLAIMGWLAATAASRGGLMGHMLSGGYVGGFSEWGWAFIMQMGAPVLVLLSFLGFVFAGIVFRISRTHTVCEVTLRREGMKVVGFTLLGHALYLVFVPLAYFTVWWQGDYVSELWPEVFVATSKFTASLMAGLICWRLSESRSFEPAKAISTV